MKLIEEIIDNLSSESPDVTNALMKTKVLLARMGEKELTKWINNELNGYEDNSDIPYYRETASRVMANSMNHNYIAKNHEVLMHHLDDSLKNAFEKTKFGNSIASLENMIESDVYNSGIKKQIPTEAYSILGKSLASGYQIQEAWSEISKNSLVQIVTEVRSRLLDFILELEDKIPTEIKGEDLKKASKNINTKSLFNNTVIGNNATILVGNNNSQTATNVLKNNDIDSLFKYFKDNNISNKDIDLLEKAINKDENLVNYEKKEFGPNVKKWFSMMLTKAIETTWNIEIGVASSLIATGLNSYYGWF